MKNKLKNIFEKVQNIPYKVCKYKKEQIKENILFGDCRHKSELLKQLLEKEGYLVKRTKVVFDWKDLPLPKKILNILKESGSVWAHDSLLVKIGNKWINIDCTWPNELKKKGFPVTENWDGLSDTKQVTEGKIKIIPIEEYEPKTKIVKEEAMLFAEKLNEFIPS